MADADTKPSQREMIHRERLKSLEYRDKLSKSRKRSAEQKIELD